MPLYIKIPEQNTIITHAGPKDLMCPRSTN